MRGKKPSRPVPLRYSDRKKHPLIYRAYFRKIGMAWEPYKAAMEKADAAFFAAAEKKAGKPIDAGKYRRYVGVYRSRYPAEYKVW